MKLTPVSILRRASPGEPSARQIAKKIGTSPNLVSMFERGAQQMAPAKVKAYAKAVGSTELEVRKRFAMTQLIYYRAMVRETNRTLKKLGVRPTRPSKRLELIA